MPSLRHISTSRKAQDTKAPVAQTVITCQKPPSFNGANPSPYLMSGGLIDISQGFHGEASHHDALNAYAIDFALLLGTPVLAARNGIVMEVIDGNPDLGGSKATDLDNANLIRIVHDDDSMAVYGHLLEGSATVKPGQWVAAGTVIAQSGNSGFSHGPHLHFAVQINTGMQLISIPFTMQNSSDHRPIVTEDF